MSSQLCETIPLLKCVGKQKICQEYRRYLNSTTNEGDLIHVENFVLNK